MFQVKQNFYILSHAVELACPQFVVLHLLNLYLCTRGHYHLLFASLLVLGK